MQRVACWLQDTGVGGSHFEAAVGSESRGCLPVMHAGTRVTVGRIRELVGWPRVATRGWYAGFLAGVFDGEGSCSAGALCLSNTSPVIIQWVREALAFFGFTFAMEQVQSGYARPTEVVRVLGGLREHLRFFHTVDPAIVRKRNLEGQPVRSEPGLGVKLIEPLGTMRLYDISTGTEDFIANGVVSHNCYARPSHAYLDLSPGIDFETKIFYKADAARLLEEELARPGYVVKPITIGANTDPYQPLERQLCITQSLLQVLERTRHPTSIITKGALILRDLPLLASMARDGLVNVFVSLTTLQPDLKRTLEPRAASPQARLRVVSELTAAGVPTAVLIAPLIPAVNDSELEHLLAAAAAAGAMSAGYVLLRLPHELKQLFREWLGEHLPERAEHVMALINHARAGRDNDPNFGSRMVGSGPFAQLLRDRFALACRRHGLTRSRLPAPSCAHFRRPGGGGQMSLQL